METTFKPNDRVAVNVPPPARPFSLWAGTGRGQQMDVVRVAIPHNVGTVEEIMPDGGIAVRFDWPAHIAAYPPWMVSLKP